MFTYLIRRLMLLPITLFFIILVNFVIINMAPGDPVTVAEISQEGATRKADQAIGAGIDDRYQQFREFYGLTLPVLFNTWPFTTEEEVRENLWQLQHRKVSPESSEEMRVVDYNALRTRLGDKARFIMPILLKIIEESNSDPALQQIAVRYFVRGGSRQAILGPGISSEAKAYNKKVAADNNWLRLQLFANSDSSEKKAEKVANLHTWYEKHKTVYNYTPDTKEKISIFFFETRFVKYMSRILRLDFGTLRNDANKTVVNEVTSRFKYSLTLAIIPMLVTFFLCQIFGFVMAFNQQRWPDYSVSLFFLVLYAIPVFVMTPFLIEKIALQFNFPFTHQPIPISGFSSPEAIYSQQVSWERLIDVMQHIMLPLVAIIYGSLAAQSRLSRTAVLEVLGHDYIRTARAKGVGKLSIMVKHVGRNAGITIVTAIASSLGIVLGGSLIVETLFEINGFGKFFYDAVLNRDYNVIMFSALAGSFLALIGYLIADITYTLLDPRITLD